MKIPLTPYRFDPAFESEAPPDADDPHAELRETFDRIARARATGAAPSGAAVFLATANPDDPLALGLTLPWLLDYLGSGMAILDVGCGAGRDLRAAFGCVGSGGRLAGIDLSPEMIRVTGASLPAGADLRVGVAELLPFQDDSFDVVVMNCCLGLTLDRGQALAQARRVLHRDGAFLLADAVTLADLPPGLGRSLSGWGNIAGDAVPASTLRLELLEAGFAIDRWRETPLDREDLMEQASALVEAPGRRELALIEDLAERLAGRLGRLHVAARRRDPPTTRA